MSITNDLQTYLQTLETSSAFSGVVLITQGERQLFAGAYGYASRAWKAPNTLETRFDTASITKLFTAVAVLQMIDQGRLAFETPVIDFLGLEDTSISKEVNVFHLLTHTSGIGDDTEEEAGEDYADLWKTRPSYMVTRTEDFLAQFIHKPANFPPGQGCRYCNCSFILLGMMVEKISGLSYRDYVRRHIFTPAGMAHSDFLRLDKVNENVAEGCDPLENEAGEIVGWEKNIYSFPPVGSPDSGAHVTAGDLDRFFRALKDGRLLSPALSEAFFQPRVFYRQRDGWQQMYGYVLWFYVQPDGKIVCCQKEGINAGVSGALRYFPEPDINVIVLSNMEEGAWGPIRQIHEWVVAGRFDE